MNIEDLTSCFPFYLAQFWGVSGGHLGGYKDQKSILGGILAILATMLGGFGPSWGDLGQFGNHLGLSWGRLGASWGRLGDVLGGSWRRLGVDLGDPGAILKDFGLR